MPRPLTQSICATVSVGLISFAHAATPAPGNENIHLFSTLSCGEWVQRASYPTGKMTNEYWLAGFMSGQAVATKINALKDTDMPSMALWIDKHCKDDPLSNSVAAAKLLFAELTKRKTGKQ